MPHTTHLLLIDPQNDFCDLPADWCPSDPATGARLAPALPVAGAHADMLRAAALLDDLGPRVDALTLTLDSHHRWDLAHPLFWQGTDGRPPAAFTPITAAQVRAGQFQPAQAEHLPRVLRYLDTLEAQGRYTLMVWPVHCQLGSWGHGVHPAVQAACNRWQDRTGRALQVVVKGMHPWTEHYSALQAEVPDPGAPDTGLNTALLARLDAAHTLLVAGEASSHCVRATVEHLVQHLPGGRPERLVLLRDAMSPVAGFEAQASQFLADMSARGVRVWGCGAAAVTDFGA